MITIAYTYVKYICNYLDKLDVSVFDLKLESL